jgi:hypothetical protein
VAIEEISVGDYVWSKPENDPAAAGEWKRVTATFVRVAMVLLLKVGGRTIETTGEHPFHVRGRGWVPAWAVEAGEEVLGKDGEWTAVDAVEKTRRIETVYNCEVEDFHTYFVGGPDWTFSVWAHNASTEAYGGNHGELKASKKRGRAGGRNGTQVDHLNQDASYGRTPSIPGNNGTEIPYSEGAATPLEGSTSMEGGEHNVKHRVLEGFWDDARMQFALTGVAPTNSEYGAALYRALREAGFSPREAYGLSDSARRQRIAYGHLDDDPVPNIPNPFPPQFLPGGSL